jgi:regulator of RNase E activity RraA
MRRLAEPEEQAAAIVFLCSPEASYVNGACQAGSQDGREVWRAVDSAAAGSVLVLSTDGGDISTLGGVIAGTAAARQLAGAVTDGLIRDTDEIAGYGFAGDLIVSDRDGAVRVPRAEVAEVMERAYSIERLERLWVEHARTYRSIEAGFDFVAREFGSPH